MTILRGKIVVEGNRVLASPADEQFLPRKIGDDMLPARGMNGAGGALAVASEG